MPLDHLGISVPDVAFARDYFDALVPLVGFEPFSPGKDWVPYAPAGGHGTQLFFCTAQDDGSYSGDQPGLQHLCFLVDSRQEVEAAHAWARDRSDEVLHEPRTFPGAPPGPLRHVLARSPRLRARGRVVRARGMSGIRRGDNTEPIRGEGARRRRLPCRGEPRTVG